MQIVAYGTQDIYLTGNPLITYFKSVYRRHTNFAIETVEANFTRTPNFGEECTAVIQRNGDLLSKAYLQVILPDITEKQLADFDVNEQGISGPNRRYTRWIDNIGHFIIKTVDIDIGGQIIDRHYGDWLEIWAQLSVPSGQMKKYREMIGQDPKNIFGQNTGLQADVFSTTKYPTGNAEFPSYSKIRQSLIPGREIYVPLQFWFCRDYGLALPLIALQHHEVKLHFKFRPVDDLIMTYQGDQENPSWVNGKEDFNDKVSLSNSVLDVSLWLDYIYLDMDERRKFAQVSHEYLIEILQYNEDTINSGTETEHRNTSLDLFFDHPTKELVWVLKGFEGNKQWSNYTNTALNHEPPFSNVSFSNNEVSHGLTGLPAGDLYFYDIDIGYIGNNRADGTQLTVVDYSTWMSAMEDNLIYFNIQDNTTFKVGDIVVINNGNVNTNLPLIVTTIDNGEPVQFKLIEKDLYDDTQYTQVSKIDRLGSTVNIDSSGNYSSISANSLSSIMTYQDLINYSSYNSVRPYNYMGLAQNPVKSAKLMLNQYDRFESKPGSYFNWYQCLKHHTGIPESPGINVYSFAIKPEEHQPSGSCNFSRIDKIRLVLEIGGLYNGGAYGQELPEGQPLKIKVFAHSYNVLRIMSGMGGLAYH